MIEIDTLVHDLILPGDARPDEEALVAALGGDEALEDWVLVDVDAQLPEYETQVSPSFPLRQRGERRLLAVYSGLGQLREDPQSQPIVATDLRGEKSRLQKLAGITSARVARLSTVGTWGDAVVLAKTASDLRAWALLLWALDPTWDQDGRRRAQPLGQAEIEAKLMTYGKRLEELDEATLLPLAAPETITREGDYLVADLLSDRDGSWDQRKSEQLQDRLAATDKFSTFPGAPHQQADASPPPPERPEPAPPPEPAASASAPITATRIGDRVILLVPEERFDLDLATALGKDRPDVLQPGDPIDRDTRQHIAQHGCGFIAPMAFLSEVFVDGKPLSRPAFDAAAESIAPDARAMVAHLPRFGPVRLIDASGKRHITSELSLPPTDLLPLLSESS